MARVNNQLLGNAGEHFVAFQLARRGIIPALIPNSAKTYNITATANGKTIKIQVKTSSGRNHPRSWYVGKNRPFPSEDLFYFFVNMWDDEKMNPEYFIVESSWVEGDPALNRERPKFYLKNDEEHRMFLANWKPIMNYLNS